MVDIKVGDWVKDDHWVTFYEVVATTDKTFTVFNCGHEYEYFYRNRNLTIRDNPTPSPVREVVTKELVDGVYGRLELTKAKDIKGINPVHIKLLTRSQKPWEGKLGFNAKELRELAKTLNEVAEFLEGE